MTKHFRTSIAQLGAAASARFAPSAYQNVLADVEIMQTSSQRMLMTVEISYGKPVLRIQRERRKGGGEWIPCGSAFGISMNHAEKIELAIKELRQRTKGLEHDMDERASGDDPTPLQQQDQKPAASVRR